MSGLYIQKFIDRVQQLELKGSKDFVCPLADAKNLHSDITKLLLKMQQLADHTAKEQNTQEDVIEINIEGGSF